MVTAAEPFCRVMPRIGQVGGSHFLDEQFVAEGAVGGGTGFLKENAGGIEGICGRRTHIVKGMDQGNCRPSPSVAVQ